MRGDAIVVGGGIGGLATAVGLTQQGWRVTVFEQAAELAPVGAGLGVAPNAVRALDWLGLGEELRARGLAHGEAGYRTASGRWLLRTRLDELQRRFDTPLVAVHRSDLHRMLAGAAADATLRTGHRVVAGRSGADHAAVSFESSSGHGEHRADLVVASDGLHSTLRHLLFPEHPGPAYAGYVTWRGVVPAAAARAIGSPLELTETWGRGRRFGIVPLADGRIYWWATASLPEGAHRDDTIDDVAARYRGWHVPIPELLAATPPGSVLRHDIHHLDVALPSYVRGHMALLGDAAHALTPDIGQGAGLALEDAVTLTSLLADAPDVPTALAAYDATRRPRTQRLVNVSARFGRLAEGRHPVVATVRDLVARLLPASALVRATADTFDWTPPPQPAREVSGRGR